MAFPSHFGLEFTSTIHNKAEGPTLPESNRVSTPFNVVITGAGKGLGYHMCLAYARAGVSGICISSRTASDLETLTDELLKINPKLNILSRTCDTTNAADVQSLVEVAKTTFDQRIDVVIANAGIISKYLYDTDTTTGEKSNRRLPKGIIEDDDFGRVIDINLMGSYNIAKYFTPVLLSSTNTSQVRAYIVITSLASHLTESHFTPVAYNVSKVAVNRMVEHMQNDHGKQGLQAFAVHPGAVLTPQTELHSTTKGDAWDACKFTSTCPFPLNPSI
jgi:NAD(P)-dependent dehydrogenase (short-subunit alcohol dehydrogenase family)